MSHFHRPVIDRLSRELKEAGRVLVAEMPVQVKERWPVRHYALDVKVLERAVGDLFEQYAFLPSPVESREALDWAMDFSYSPHHIVGAVVEPESPELPPHSSLISESFLRTWAKDIVGAFMKGPSYEGYLMWWRA